jgi:hypothetical protein
LFLALYFFEWIFWIWAIEPIHALSFDSSVVASSDFVVFIFLDCAPGSLSVKMKSLADESQQIFIDWQCTFTWKISRTDRPTLF